MRSSNLGIKGAGDQDMTVQGELGTGSSRADDTATMPPPVAAVRSGVVAAADYGRYYDLESYLLNSVQHRFADKGYLFAFDLFCIVVWNASESEKAVACKLRAQGFTSLDAASCVLTRELSQKTNGRERLRCLWGKWGFGLPLASAILSVLYPDEFALYDTRVCEALGGSRDLAELTDFEQLWQGYLEFKQAVEGSAPSGRTLRDKQRDLCGRHVYEQLQHDIERGFREGV